jgi:hypothetical protein
VEPHRQVEGRRHIIMQVHAHQQRHPLRLPVVARPKVEAPAVAQQVHHGAALPGSLTVYEQARRGLAHPVCTGGRMWQVACMKAKSACLAQHVGCKATEAHL